MARLPVQLPPMHPCTYRQQCAAVTGNYPERMCAPMAEYFSQRGGEVRVNSRLQRIDLNSDGSVQSFRLADGSTVEGDLYISAMPGGGSPA